MKNIHHLPFPNKSYKCSGIGLIKALCLLAFIAFSYSLSAQTSTWKGTVDSDWGNADNWLGGTLPSSNQIILIESSNNDPIIENDGIISVSFLDIRPGAKLTIGDGEELIVNRILSTSSRANISVDPNGTLENRGIINITGNTNRPTAFGIYNEGTVINQNPGNLQGLGQINIEEMGRVDDINGRGIFNEGIFINYVNSEINIEDTHSSGIVVFTNGEFTNEGSMHIEGIFNNPSGSHGGIQVYPQAEFTNEGSIDILDTQVGIQSFNDGDFINNGSISVREATLDGIQVEKDGQFTNNNTINVDECKFGIRLDDGDDDEPDPFTSPSFTNTVNGTININQRFEQESIVGILLGDGNFVNDGGLIRIDYTLDVSGGSSRAIDIGYDARFTNQNKGLIFIGALGSDVGNDAIALFHDGEFFNGSCAGVINQSSKKIRVATGTGNNGNFKNNSWIISYSEQNNSISSNAGTILNFGDGSFDVAIEDNVPSNNDPQDISQNAFCSGKSIQFSQDSDPFNCNGQFTYRRLDNNESNTTGIFDGLIANQSYDFELTYSGEVVDTHTYMVDNITMDTEAPNLQCTTNYVFDLDDDPNPSINVNDFTTVTDNCGVKTLLIQGQGETQTFGCDDFGTNTVVIEAMDTLGNSSTCSITVEITGVYPPPSTPMTLDLDIYLDANGEATLSESDLLFFPNLETACFTRAEAEANYSVPVAYQNLDCDDVGTFSFFLEEADSNFPDAEQTINVIDPIPITASVANITVSLDASGVASLSVEDLTFTVSDNCYTDTEIIATYSVPSEFSMFDCMDIGTFSVTLDKSDSSFPGITFQVTVESSELSFPAISTDFCSNSSFDLTTLEKDITTASGTFTYTQAIERLYIPNFNDHNVSVIDLNTNSIIQNIDVGMNPWGVGVRPDGKKVYTANYGSSDISVIDVATNTLEATIGVGQLPIGIAFNSDGSRLYVTNSLDSDVSIINTTTNTVINTISVGLGPWGIALSPDDSKIYVAEEGDNTLGVFNATTGASITNIPVQRNPKGLAISADGTKLYVGCESKLFPNEADGAISIIDISTDLLIQTLDIDYKESIVLAVHPAGDIYAGHDDTGSGIISRITPSNLITHYTIEAGIYNNIRGISLNEDGSRLYISGSAEDKVIIFNTLTNTEMTTIAVGDSPISTGNFYVKTTIDITSPSSYIPSEGSIINVAFDGGAECESTTTITFTEAYTPVDLLGVVSIVEADSLFNHADTIQTMGTVEVEANDEIIFEAAEVVLLQEGFHAKAGSVFTARIRVCGEGSESNAEEEEIEERSEEENPYAATTQVKLDELQVNIFPNPFSSETTIKFHLSEATDVVLLITDRNGRTVHQKQYVDNQSGWQEYQFEARHLSDGMYFLYMRSAEQQLVKKLVIQK